MRIHRNISVVALGLALAGAVTTPAYAQTTVVHTTDASLAATCERQVGHVFQNGSWVLIYQDGVCKMAVDPLGSCEFE